MTRYKWATMGSAIRKPWNRKSLLSSQFLHHACSAMIHRAEQRPCAHKTQFQCLVPISALYSRISVLAGWMVTCRTVFCSIGGRLCGQRGQCGMCHRRSMTLTILTVVRNGGHNFPHCPAAGIGHPRFGLGSAVPLPHVFRPAISHPGPQSVLMASEDVETCPHCISQ